MSMLTRSLPYVPPQHDESGIIDMDIFSQIQEMDDDDDREFSRTIVWNYFDQASGCFADMDDAL